MSGLTNTQKLLEGKPFDLTIKFKGSGEVVYKCFLPDDWEKIAEQLRAADELIVNVFPFVCGTDERGPDDYWVEEHPEVIPLFDVYLSAKGKR